MTDKQLQDLHEAQEVRRAALLDKIDELDRRGYECQRRGETTNAQLAWGNMNALSLDLDELAD